MCTESIPDPVGSHDLGTRETKLREESAAVSRAFGATQVEEKHEGVVGPAPRVRR